LGNPPDICQDVALVIHCRSAGVATAYEGISTVFEMPSFFPPIWCWRFGGGKTRRSWLAVGSDQGSVMVVVEEPLSG
jgi:hypothetical protein